MDSFAHSAAEKQILDYIIGEVLDEPRDITEKTSLFRERLLDSMNLTQLLVFLESNFKIKIGPMDVVFENLDTVENMIRFIESRREGK